MIANFLSLITEIRGLIADLKEIGFSNEEIKQVALTLISGQA